MAGENEMSLKNPSGLSNAEREKKMLEKMQRGEAIESPDEMSDDYFGNLTDLMLQQADSELAGAFGYVSWIMRAPTVEEKLAVASVVKDEMHHARAMYRLLEDLGLDADAHIARHDYALRIDSKAAELNGKRVSDDRRVSVFYYPIDTWADFVMFQFCADRAARHQLEDVHKSTYGPWRREIGCILKEEMTHVGHGDYWVKKMALDRSTKSEIQAALNKWYPRTMNIFGKPNSHRNKIHRKYGLKVRDNDEVRKAFSGEVRLKCSEWALNLPGWKPESETAAQKSPFAEEDGAVSSR